ncbi:glutathione S-transferase family protein [Maritimibacter sp. UBA3975]|uniref:glutathione S-transferase family protein n=1 Tax=Maritimibacter sp. UBA3975 TaxID=1946833 RepID=UPI000C090210|nr:glutathione S-transferase family protein [Maritimibacter sp. UBA3975]MAM63249.1 glutathione S-transferase [Maritimibacter sp.]|tara:strand:+ start:22232 stop:22828 length:597 start_codon:yes stop_codon:yes gene_type:complete
MYTLIGKIDTRAFRALWMLEELGEPYDWVKAGPGSEEVMAHNPSGKVPVLLVDGEPVADSVAIMQFLADRHGRFTHPAGTLERARQDAVTNFLIDDMDALLWMGARHVFVLPEEHRMPEIRSSLKWEFARAVERCAEILGDKPFLTGDEMTVPDILATHCATWARSAKFPLENEVFNAFTKRMRGREAFGRTAALAQG